MSRSKLAYLAAALLLGSAVPALAAPPDAARLYETYCVQCHGSRGNGKGINAAHMSTQPRDHSDPKGMGNIPDDELFNAIRGGGISVNKSILMPAWSSVFSDEQIHALVRHLRKLCQCGPDGASN
jgi:cytochrome c oxidase cbb3-type subunit 3